MYTTLNVKRKCILLMPYANVVCDFAHKCNYCDIAYQIRKNKGETVMQDEDLLRWCDALPMTKKMNGADFYLRPVILKPDVLRAHGITTNLLYQIFFVDGGSGAFASKPAGLIEGYLVADRNRRLQITRHDVFGVPNDATVERFFETFGIDLKKEGLTMK